MRQAEDNRHGHRLNALILELWPAELRIQEALSLTETDLDQRRGSFLVRHGKNDRRREVGMDAWAWSAIDQPARRGSSYTASRSGQVCVCRFAPHQLRHPHTIEFAARGQSRCR